MYEWIARAIQRTWKIEEKAKILLIIIKLSKWNCRIKIVIKKYFKVKYSKWINKVKGRSFWNVDRIKMQL